MAGWIDGRYFRNNINLQSLLPLLRIINLIYTAFIIKRICNVYINQRDTQILVNSLYFFVKWLYMFRTTISPSSGATFNKLYNVVSTCWYHTSGCSMAIAIQQPDVPVCTDCAVQLIKRCSWWWTNGSPKHVEPFNEKIRTIHKNLWISAIWCTLHVTKN